MQRKEQIVTAAKNFGGISQDIQIRSRFAAGDQIMFAYYMVVPTPIGKLAVLMEFTDRLITMTQLKFQLLTGLSWTR